VNQPQERSARLPFPPVVLAIAGCSGSGKTTLAAELARTLDGVHFHLDNYYRDLSHLRPEERVKQNMDDPAVIESPLLAAHVAALARGESIERPLYDFATYSRIVGQTETVRAGAYLLVEGIFALYYPNCCPLPPAHLRRHPGRAVLRAASETGHRAAGRTPESVRRQYEATVRPSSLAFVRPSALNAHLIIDGAGALDWKVERVLGEMRKRGLLAFPE